MPLLSVIVPVYNEARTIRQIIEKIASVGIQKEIIIVDDGSSDGTGKVLRELNRPDVKIIYHGSNRGKGAAFLTGLANASGELVIIQDADLEYDPAEYLKLLGEIQKEGTDIVLGARFMAGYHGLLIPMIGNRILTGLLNFLFRVKLNDILTCYKLMRRDTLNSLGLRSQNFDIDTEIVAKAIKNNLMVKQIPVSYHPRSYKEGKKIRLLDGIRYMISIVKYRF